MRNEGTRRKIAVLHLEFQSFGGANETTRSEIAESMHNSNTIENFTLTLQDMEDIFVGFTVKGHTLREVYEANDPAGAQNDCSPRGKN
ncbi:hypothetical protein [Corynebacterium sp. H130]|uniref:hypothetical protein n=1 Tax=Corynebacterium sp. H130 TaxID=3133444 RepID=UPI00309DFE89